MSSSRAIRYRRYNSLRSGVFAFTLNTSGQNNLRKRAVSPPQFSLRVQFPSLPSHLSPTIQHHTTHLSKMLLTLPRELRNQIYHHLWSSVPARALSTGHTAWYFCVPMPLSLLSNPIPVGLPSWLPTSRAMLQEGLEQFHIHGAIQTDLTYDHDLTFPPLLSPSNARNVQVTLRLAPVTASVAAVYREIERVDARGLARLGQATGDEQQIKIHIQFDREAHLACILDPSPIDLLMQDRIEIVVSGVQIGSEGELTVLRAAAEL
jgi:hypothetical protein